MLLKPRPRPPLTILSALLLTVCVIPMLAGCQGDGNWFTDPGGAEPIRDAIEVAERESAALDQVIADIEAQLATLPAGEDRDELAELLAEAKAGKSKADAVVSDLKVRLADADTGLDAIAAGLQSAGPLVPPPYGLYLTIAGGALATLSEVLRRRTKRAAADVIVSIERAKENHGGVVDFNSATTASELRSRMSTEARQLVESVQRKTGGGNATLTVKAIDETHAQPTTG